MVIKISFHVHFTFFKMPYENVTISYLYHSSLFSYQRIVPIIQPSPKSKVSNWNTPQNQKF